VEVENGGARITELSPNGAAELAGLQSRDVIHAVNGSPVNSPAELVNAVASIPAGSKVLLGYAVKGMWHAEATATLGKP
jgi:S1-C subfamily serine protease